LNIFSELRKYTDIATLWYFKGDDLSVVEFIESVNGFEKSIFNRYFAILGSIYGEYLREGG